jgi:hypothetical protein
MMMNEGLGRFLPSYRNQYNIDRYGNPVEEGFGDDYEQQLAQYAAQRGNVIGPQLQEFKGIRNPYLDQEATEVPMVQAQPSTVLGRIFDLPSYQLMFGAGPQSMDPALRFRFDPGYQFAQDEGLRQIAQNSSAQGLLGSTSMVDRMLERSQGFADQNYQRWLSQQAGVYSDYQNRLQGLMGMGPAVSGADNAMALGGALSQGTLGTGGDIGGLYANQGVFGGSGMLNTGAAQSGNIMQGLGIQAQVAAANAAGSGGGGGTLGGIGSVLSGVGNLFGGRF